jgi:hypothetical protein
VPSADTDRAVATLDRREPCPDLVNDLDVPYAFNGPRPFNFIGASPALQSLMTQVVATVDGHDIVVASDDVGDLQFQVETAEGNYNVVSVGPHVTDVQRVPAVDDAMFRGLWAVPADVASVRVTLDDGTVVEPHVVDVTSLADAKLLFVADDLGIRRITAVDVQRD